ncbi:hypothetical protein CCHR01_11633 [Colletotrichum chrysophilum]|uniref:Uncharacterized protein n=1 Tax=Colletotrichum chrysophilum TaxID=1836956 RepID=A0AAD9ACN7_9PEZI|nr:hypothetical protein CCHR01_11633 [Colletotrichum chrysophilum]
MSLVAETVRNDDLVDPAARPVINSGAERDSCTHPRPSSRCSPGQCGDDTGLHSGIGAGAKTTQDGSNAIKMAGDKDVECCVTGTPGSATPGISRRREKTASWSGGRSLEFVNGPTRRAANDPISASAGSGTGTGFEPTDREAVGGNRPGQRCPRAPRRQPFSALIHNSQLATFPSCRPPRLGPLIRTP